MPTLNWTVILQFLGQVVPFTIAAETEAEAIGRAIAALRGAGFQEDTNALNAAIADDERREAISRAIADATLPPAA